MEQLLRSTNARLECMESRSSSNSRITGGGKHYSWTYSLTRNSNHTSRTCRTPTNGHKNDAMFANRLGGSNLRCSNVTEEAAWRYGSQLVDLNKLITNNIIFCNNLTLTNLTSSYAHAILDLGASGNFLSSKAPLICPHLAVQSVRAKLPDDTCMEST